MSEMLCVFIMSANIFCKCFKCWMAYLLKNKPRKLLKYKVNDKNIRNVAEAILMIKSHVYGNGL